MVTHIFNNRYHLDEKLGDGGTAVVYSGTDALLRRRVAVKVLRPQYAADAEFVRRFYHEAESAAKLTHPNIVNIYDVGRENESYYIVMELVDGATLAKELARKPVQAERDALDYAVQICRALAYAHRQGLLHRDIKPANMLITKDGIVKLSDFGIARAVERQTMAMTEHGMIMGSVFYLSPEQAQDRELQPSSDLYSLGVVLYEMLVGHPPFTGASPIAIALKHLSEPPPPMPESITPAFAAIVMRLLEKDPEARYANAEELIAALRSVREATRTEASPPGEGVPLGAPTSAMPMVEIPNPPPRPSPFPDRPAQGARRRAWWKEAALIAATVLLGLGIGYLVVAEPGLFRRFAVQTIKVPSEVGGDLAQAQSRLTALGFQVKTTTGESKTIAENHVISQDPPGGSSAPSGGTVTLTLSSGLPVIDVPDLISFSADDAKRLLAQRDLTARVSDRFDPAPKDTVVAQRPAAHTKLRMNAPVSIVISDGPKPVTVPNVVALTVEAARKGLERDHLTLVIGQQSPSDDIPAGTIASQDPKGGSSLAYGGTVTVVVSTGAAPAAVPDVTLARVEEAVATMQNAGFIPQVSYSVQPGESNGSVIGETPVGGTHARRGTPVSLVVAVAGIVPDVTGMTLEAARAALQNAGYNVGNVAETQDGSDGKIARTEPAAGTTLRPGESIVIYQNDLAPDFTPLPTR